jgi:tetraacyldisaccharide 4'-kinase
VIGVRRPRWFDERDANALRRIALAPLVPLSWAYGLGALASRRLRSPRFRPATRLSCRVVSVGNLGVGGAGKTPAAAWIASQLRARGHKVALASRGYGGRGREPVTVVSDGRFVCATADEAGDEPLLLAGHAPGVPVLVGPDRRIVGLRAIAAFGVDVLVLDDGFQHHRLERDVEVVAFDGSGLGNGHLLPRGPLREPLSALRGADAILVIDGPLPQRDADAIAAHAGAAQWFSARRRPVSLRPLAGGAATAPGVVAGHRVGILCGIARPASLRRSLEALGATVVEERSFPDHHRYRERDLRNLSPARIWITTEKDALKILPRWAHGADVRVLASALEVEHDEAFVDWLERTLRAKRR